MKALKVYFGVIGKNSAGKETVYLIFQELIKKYAPNLKVNIHHFSDPLRECLAVLRPLPGSKENQQIISTVLRQGFGEEVLGNALVHRAQNDAANIVFLDGIRRPQDVPKFLKLPNSHLILVDAPFEKRLQHAQSRTDRPAPTREQFLAQENAEPERLIDKIAKQANITLTNSGTLEELEGQIFGKILIRKLGIINVRGVKV